jgi:hypothetical protein
VSHTCRYPAQALDVQALGSSRSRPDVQARGVSHIVPDVQARGLSHTCTGCPSLRVISRAVGHLSVLNIQHRSFLVYHGTTRCTPGATDATTVPDHVQLHALRTPCTSRHNCAEASQSGAESPRVPPEPPVPLLRERNRVLVAEALQHAASSANTGHLDTACNLLADAEAMISRSSSMLKKDPLSERLLEVLTSALRRLEDALGEQKWRAAPSTLLEKLPSPQQGAVVRGAGVFPPARWPRRTGARRSSPAPSPSRCRSRWDPARAAAQRTPSPASPATRLARREPSPT